MARLDLKKSVALLLIASMMTACAGSRVQQDFAVPPELLKNKADLPVSRTWDRWEESTGDEYLLGKADLIRSENLNKVLADDPDLKVRSELSHATTWETIGQISGTIGGLAVIAALVGYIPDSDTKERSFDISTINLFWGIAAIGFTGMGVGFGLKQQAQDRAINLHNERLLKQHRAQAPTLMVRWKF